MTFELRTSLSSLHLHLYLHDVFCSKQNFFENHFHPKTLIEMWIICLDPVSANFEKGRGSEWAVRAGQKMPSRFVQSGAAREINLVQIVVEAPALS